MNPPYRIDSFASRSRHILLSIFLMAFALLFNSPLHAQESPGTAPPAPAAGSAPVAPAPAPAAPITPSAAPAARRPEDEPAGAATDTPTALNLNWLQRQAANVMGIPTASTLATSNASLQSQIETQRAQIATLTQQLADARSANVALNTDLTQINGFIDQLRTAPAALAAPAVLTTLPPAQQAAAAAVTTAVSTHLRGIGQPPDQLPGPGAAPAANIAPLPTALAASTRANEFLAAHWEKKMPNAASSRSN